MCDLSTAYWYDTEKGESVDQYTLVYKYYTACQVDKFPTYHFIFCACRRHLTAYSGSFLSISCGLVDDEEHDPALP
jgi:hypothetical protein